LFQRIGSQQRKNTVRDNVFSNELEQKAQQVMDLYQQREGSPGTEECSFTFIFNTYINYG